MTLIHLHIVWVLIHNLQYDLILLLVLLIQSFYSYCRKSKYCSKPTFRLLVIDLLLLLLRRFLILCLFRRILIVLASMLSLDLAFHKLLSCSEVTSLSVATISFFLCWLVLPMLLVDSAHIGMSFPGSRLVGFLPALELIEELLSIRILPFTLLEIVSHAQGHVKVAL